MTEPREPTCRSCKIRMRVEPIGRDMYNPITLSSAHVRWLENAARVFDDEGELFTAAEFVAWLRPDLIGRATVDHGVVVTTSPGNPIEYNDPKHKRLREAQRAYRARKRDAA